MWGISINKRQTDGSTCVKFLKSHADRARQKGIVKTLLEKSVGKMDKPHSVAGYMHASTLTNERAFCPREIRLLDHTGKKLPERYIDPALKTTFDEGWDKQWRLSNDWLRDRARGTWKCRSCGERSKFGPAPSYDSCEFLGHNGEAYTMRCQWDYQEPLVLDEANGISGGLDLLVDVGQEKLRFVECKIIAQSQFKDLRAPKGEHRTRTNLYLALIKQHEFFSQVVCSETASVLYICRGYGTKQDDGDISPFKEFTVTYDADAAEPYLNNAALVMDTRKEETIPLAKICPSIACKRAGQCPVREECFRGNY